MIDILITRGYGNTVKIVAKADGEEYVMDKQYIEEVLADLIVSRGYTVLKTRQQKYPRLIINK